MLATNFQRLIKDKSGVSMVEFALAFPMLATLCFGGLEYVNFVLSYQKIERITSLTADALARNTLPPSERTFIDTFRAMDLVGAPFRISDHGRSILTGVIGVAQGDRVVNKIVWQRCGGRLTSAVSRIGAEWRGSSNYADGPNVTLPNGITLLQNQMVVVSEVAYRYQPMINVRQLVSFAPDGIIRQRSVFVTRGQAIPHIAPFAGLEPARC